MMPGEVGESKSVIRTVFSVAKNAICLSIMNQYTPMTGIDFARFPELRRTVSEDEYGELIDYALALGVTNSFMQEGGTAEASFIPPFDLTGV
jgi:putative pyruvate formate lyase activating enzyme